MADSQDHRTIRVGIIGVGQIGKAHIETYKKIPEVEIVAVAEINEAEAQRVGEMHSIAQIYTDFRKLLQRDDIDAVKRPVATTGLRQLSGLT